MQLPPLHQIAAALRKTTEVLARELAVPTSEAPPWTEFEWRIARAASAMHGVSSLLYGRLLWKGPESWQRFLAEQRDHTIGRHGQIARLLDAVDSQARREGMAIVALKGAALHASMTYAAGERPMGDIDLLVHDEGGEAISPILQACGYGKAFVTNRHDVFQPVVSTKILPRDRLGEHVDASINIEVHFRIAEHLPVREVDITQFLHPHAPHAGLNEYSSIAALMLHLLLHAAGNMRARALRLIQLHDIALLSLRFAPGDWEELIAMRPAGRTIWWAFAPLALTTRYYPATIPPDLLARLAPECPWLLGRRARRQQLTEVSWSNIRIEAFPGWEWSQTPGEVLQFMRSRIWPSREARSELKEGAAQIPGSATIPWYGISHGARILRWIFTRPPRVQTLLPVRAALAAGDDGGNLAKFAG